MSQARGREKTRTYVSPQTLKLLLFLFVCLLAEGELGTRGGRGAVRVRPAEDLEKWPDRRLLWTTGGDLISSRLVSSHLTPALPKIITGPMPPSDRPPRPLSSSVNFILPRAKASSCVVFSASLLYHTLLSSATFVYLPTCSTRATELVSFFFSLFCLQVHYYYDFSDWILPPNVGTNRPLKIMLDQSIYFVSKCAMYISLVSILRR